jgi:hypothetical protein
MFAEDGMFRKIAKWSSISLGVLLVLFVAALLAFFSPGLYNRFSYFPREKAAWEQLAKTRVDVGVNDGWTEYKGSIHSHSELSHDSKAAFADIEDSLKGIGSNFIMMSDHFVDGKADYSLGWKGDHGGVLFIRGFEMQGGLMPWGLPDSTVFSSKEEVGAVAKKVKELGGIVTYAHCEEKRQWDVPELEAMEIYNVHPTVNKYKNDKKWLWRTGTTALTCFNDYADQCFYTLYERPDEVLRKWDDLNVSRHISGFAGNDTHQNSGIQGMCLPNGNLMICDTGHRFDNKEQASEVKLNFFTRTLLRALYGPLEPGKLLFRYDLDKYVRSAKYVRTHLLAKSCTEPDLIEALRAGRAFLSFDMVADGTGFVYMAQGAQNKAVMGESIKMEPGLTLKAFSPYKSKFALMRNGIKIDEQEGRDYSFSPTEKGKYRLEVSLKVLDKDQLWLLTNPIEVTN